MPSTIALVGRANVGKSTLFNYLTRSRDALVADHPGLTRDRQYGQIKQGDRSYIVVDTGGFVERDNGIDSLTNQQVLAAIDEANLVIFLVDAREGLNPFDISIANELRKKQKPIVLAANKTDGLDAGTACTEFHALAIGDPVPIAASHGRGVPALLANVASQLAPELETETRPPDDSIAIAVIGRPNVGKSTLVNRLLGEQRVVVFDQPGTTRDSIFIPFERDGKRFTLIDTAGVRRRSRVSEKIEKFSVIKTLNAINHANVVIYLVDASEAVTDQDATLLGMVLEAGKALVIGLNKWDGLDDDQKRDVRRQIDLKLPFLNFAEKHRISALHGTGVGGIFDVVNKIYSASMVELSTTHLTNLLHEALAGHQPPLVRGRRIKLKFAHQGGHNPPVIVIHGNLTAEIPTAYRRYLTNFYRQKLNLLGTPLKLSFVANENPFKTKKPNRPGRRAARSKTNQATQRNR